MLDLCGPGWCQPCYEGSK